MCEEERFGIVEIPCSICTVEKCDQNSHGIKIRGCGYGKPSNEIILWAFAYTNKLRSMGIPKTHA